MDSNIFKQEYPREIIPVASYFTSNGISDCISNLFSSLKILYLLVWWSEGCFKFFNYIDFYGKVRSYVWALNSLWMSFTFWTRSQKGMHQSKKARHKNLAIKWT